MNQEKKQEFTRRLTNCNRGGIVVLNYDILFAHLEDAKKALQGQEWEAYKKSLRKASEAVKVLMKSLDFKYEIAEQLFALYAFSKKELAVCMYEKKQERIETIETILRRPYLSFVEIAKQDNSAPIMSNTQQVYSGMTYGRNHRNEEYIADDNKRGFFV